MKGVAEEEVFHDGRDTLVGREFGQIGEMRGRADPMEEGPGAGKVGKRYRARRARELRLGARRPDGRDDLVTGREPVLKSQPRPRTKNGWPFVATTVSLADPPSHDADRHRLGIMSDILLQHLLPGERARRLAARQDEHTGVTCLMGIQTGKVTTVVSAAKLLQGPEND
ncbi:MAG: hypothetical protein R3D33_00855 [Hyphomicrobiaceae bacterium]